MRGAGWIGQIRRDNAPMGQRESTDGTIPSGDECRVTSDDLQDELSERCLGGRGAGFISGTGKFQRTGTFQASAAKGQRSGAQVVIRRCATLRPATAGLARNLRKAHMFRPGSRCSDGAADGELND